MSEARPARVLEADLTWTGDGFEPDVRVVVGEGGSILAVERGSGDHAPAAAPTPVERLSGRALLPGFVNAHSHAFQRGLRGHGETFPPGRADAPASFWSWREAMYRLVESLGPESTRALTLRAFREMRRAGITAVGEFHYLHHAPGSGGYELDAVVLEAAREAGIRIVLLSAYYATGSLEAHGHGPLTGSQTRFATPGLDGYWHALDRLAGALEPRTQSLGIVAHSIRAAPIEAVAELHAESVRRRLPFHMHVEEQMAEVEACRAHYRRTPMELLLERIAVDDRFTAVHCTHTTPADLRAFAETGATACLCPLTEANLADGIPDLPALLEAGGRFALGTDSNARISMLEEMRLAEYAQRLVQHRRGVVVDEWGRVAHRLLRAATAAGARALSLPAGEIAPNRLADFALVDLGAPSLEGWDRETLPHALVFGGADDAIVGSIVAGVGP